ncbi:MAG: tripartite tricarboxylate transporter TctB family protein [Phycisphaerales bacterium]|nr:tripartite tricarboxylate transporter TctB family protein [Phycisphaerales bacterium]
MAKYRDLIGGVFFLAFAVFIYALSYQIHMTQADPVGPQFFPRLVALFMGVLALISISRSVLRLRKADPTATAKKGSFSIALLLTALLLIAYTLLIEKVGFIILSAIYLYLQILLISPKEELQKHNLVINAVVAIVVPIALYYLFYHAFGIFLPAGLLE